MKVITYAPFGYEGSLVDVEVDLRKGIPAVDIVGISDAAVKETRERIRAAISNSGFEFPSERVLISLSPADTRKDNPMDLAVALAILNANGQVDNETIKDILILGELELSGNIRPVRGAYAALKNAKVSGITYAVLPENNPETIEGMNIIRVSNLREAVVRINYGDFKKEEVNKMGNEVIFEECSYSFDDVKGNYWAKYGLMVAAAGRHSALFIGAPGCGKTMLAQRLPAITPTLTDEESQSVTRVWSLAGLLKPSEPMIKVRPFRMPHQTATIEGICGGGPNCRPGEISLAHNGTLFLDEAAEFRSSCLQMLRVPLESNSICLSRAGRSTVYPAHFQLIMTANPCPCGNYGVKDRICLCSTRSIEMYWKKFSDPLLSRVPIKIWVDQPDDTRSITTAEIKQKVKVATEIQRTREVYNNDLTPDQLNVLFNLDEESREMFFKLCNDAEFSPREIVNMEKVCITIANLDGRTQVTMDDVMVATNIMQRTYC